MKGNLVLNLCRKGITLTELIKVVAKNKLRLIDEQLRIAYQTARYQVLDSPILLTVGKQQAVLDELLMANNCSSAAFVTAYNPHSTLLATAENQKRHQQLINLLSFYGYTFLAAQSSDPHEKWPTEQSVLILGINKSDAISFGQLFEQNAVIYHRLACNTELIWCI